MILEDGPLFIADTQVNSIPTPEQIAETIIGAARHARRFGVTPKVAICAHSNFGNLDTDSGRRMRAAMEHSGSQQRSILTMKAKCRSMQRSTQNCATAFSPTAGLRVRRISWSLPITDAASTARNILKMKAGGLEVGPILMGMGNRAHIVTPSITARGLLNMSALAGTPVAHYG